MVLSQKPESLGKRGHFLNNEELVCWREIYSLASSNECTLLSKSHIVPFRTWDKTQSLELCCALSSARRISISILAHVPAPFLRVQCHLTQSSHSDGGPEPLEHSRWSSRLFGPCSHSWHRSQQVCISASHRDLQSPASGRC